MSKRFFLTLFILVTVFCILLFLNRQTVLSVFPTFKKVLPAEVTPTLRVNFLDIGQGDATLFEFPNGEQMLVDCALDSRVLEALGRVMSPLDRTLDYVVLTHAHKDHYGGCIDVVQRFEIKNIILSSYQKKTDKFYNEFLEAAQAEGAVLWEIQNQQTVAVGSSTLYFFYPDHDVSQNPAVPGYEKDTGTNNTSLTFLVNFEDVDILMTGDAEAELETYLVQKYQKQLDADVLKVGHHGSAGSSLQEFLEVVTPQHAIISSGVGNSYGHPSPRALSRLKRAQAQIWRTDLQGDILLKVENKEIYVETRR